MNCASFPRESPLWLFLVTVFLCYSAMTSARKTLTWASSGLMKEFEYDKSDIGIMSTMLSLSYGVSKFLGGTITDYVSPALVLFVGLICSGLCCIIFSMNSSFSTLCFIWTVNGFFQGGGWPPIARLLTVRFPPSTRGFYWSVISCAGNLAFGLAPVILGFLFSQHQWRAGFVANGLFPVLSAVLIPFTFPIFALKAVGKASISTSSASPSSSLSSSSISSAEKKGKGKSAPVLAISMATLRSEVLKSDSVWLLSIASVFLFFPRAAVQEWGALFLSEARGISHVEAASVIGTFELVGLLGTLAIGPISDKWGGKRMLVNFLFAVITVVASLVVWWGWNSTNSLVFHIAFGLFGFASSGPKTLISVAIAEFVHPNITGFAFGIYELIAQIGTALAGYPLGLLMEYMGWNGILLSLVTSPVVLCLLFAPLVNRKPYLAVDVKQD